MTDFARTWPGETTSGRLGMHLAWAATESHIQEAQAVTHDRLIEEMGDNRVGPVEWRLFRMIPGLEVLDELARLDNAGETPPILDGVQARMREEHAQLRSNLERHGGYLVVAMAAART